MRVVPPYVFSSLTTWSPAERRFTIASIVASPDAIEMWSEPIPFPQATIRGDEILALAIDSNVKREHIVDATGPDLMDKVLQRDTSDNISTSPTVDVVLKDLSEVTLTPSMSRDDAVAVLLHLRVGLGR